jgi:hypothetical protein
MRKYFHIALIFCGISFCVGLAFGHSDITCGLGFVDSLKAKTQNPLPMSIASPDTLDQIECSQKAEATYYLAQTRDNQKTYDSSRYVIDHCAIYTFLFPGHVASFFGEATGALGEISNDPTRWLPYRDWLKKVLYYNMDSDYYCSDVGAIIVSMQYFNAERGVDRNGTLAIIKYLQDSHLCGGHFFMVPWFWTQTRIDQHDYWRDTAKNPQIPLDTTLPLLEDLNLQILRGPQYAAVKNAFSPSTNNKINYLSVSENPFKEATTLNFELSDAEYMKIEIFDLLGNKIYSDSKLFNGGDEQWQIDGKNLARGSFYARLSTMGGEVKTVKLIHE